MPPGRACLLVTILLFPCSTATFSYRASLRSPGSASFFLLVSSPQFYFSSGTRLGVSPKNAKRQPKTLRTGRRQAQSGRFAQISYCALAEEAAKDSVWPGQLAQAVQKLRGCSLFLGAQVLQVDSSLVESKMPKRHPATWTFRLGHTSVLGLFPLFLGTQVPHAEKDPSSVSSKNAQRASCQLLVPRLIADRESQGISPRPCPVLRVSVLLLGI